MRHAKTILIFAFLLTGCVAPVSQEPTVIPTNTPTLTPVPMETATITLTAPLPTVTPTLPAQTGMDAATFLTETYPDYSILTPGETFIKTWDIKNTGSNTWNEQYSLVLDAMPQNDALGSPNEIYFSEETLPGGTKTLSVHLTAPLDTGTYSVYWKLENKQGQTFGVDGDRVWVTIMVCASEESYSPPQTGGSTTLNKVSVTLKSFTADSQNTTAQFCMTLPNRNYGPGPGTVFLVVNQQSVIASSGGTLDVGCFEFAFPVTETQMSQAKDVAVSIGQVRTLGGVNDPQGACETARPNPVAQYPGLDFQCHFSMAGYYTDLQVPTGMTTEQAKQMVVDAIEGTIYGPWVLTIK